MGPVVVIVALPLPQLPVEEVNIVGHAFLVQELIELLVIDAVRAFHFAIQARRVGAVFVRAHVNLIL